MGDTRALFLLPDLRGGGAEKVTLNVISGIVARGASAALCMIASGEVAHDIPANLVCRDGYVGAPADVVAALLRNRHLRLVRHAARCDVLVGALELKTHLVAALLGSVLHKPIVLWLHKDLAPFLGRKKPLTRWIYTKLLAAAMRRAARIVAVGEGVARSLAAAVPETVQKTVCIPNPIDFSAIDSLLSLPQPGAGSRGDFILMVGRFTWQKGLDVLLDAFHRVTVEFPALKLVMLGDGELREALEHKVAELGLEERVEMPGFKPPYRAMAEASILVMSSRFEGLPTVLIEGLYSGSRIVATDCRSGPAEILGNGEYGTLVPVDAPAELAQAIMALLRSQDSDALRAARRLRALDFSFDSVIPQWQALLAECR